MNIILLPAGSAGDINPFISIGQELKRRGHRISLFANAIYQALVEEQGFEFVATGSQEEFEQAIADPAIWDPRRGFKIIAQRLMIRPMPLLFEQIEQRYEKNNTLIVAPLYAFGARLAQEKLGVPLVSLALQPVVFWSEQAPPVMAAFRLPGWLPAALKRLALRALERYVIDKTLMTPLNAYRQQLALAPIRHIYSRWAASPQCVIGAFADWYAPPPPDWPKNLTLCGFASYDLSREQALPQAAQAFLDAGDPPIIFTPGSAMSHGSAFFRAAVQACRLLNRRALLLTRFKTSLPSDLPDTIAHFDYLPFSQVFSQAAAIVHHGGIGTLAYALAAGKPQLVMPMTHDQPDNAARLTRLGVGDSLAPKHFTGAAVAARLQALLDSKDVQRRCQALQARMDFTAGTACACDIIESMTNA